MSLVSNIFPYAKNYKCDYRKRPWGDFWHGTYCGGNYDQKGITQLHDYCFIVQAGQSQYIRKCCTKVDHKLYDYHFTVSTSFTL